MMTALYIAMIVIVNMLFATRPEHSAWWALIVGLIFVARDFAQREIGHYVLLAMAGALVLTWLMASPFVALASAAAFAASELIDWIVYTAYRKPLQQRVIVSSLISVPVDTVIFLAGVGLLTPQLVALQIASKMVAAVIVWAALAFKPA